MKFHSIDFKAVDWKHLDSFEDRTVFQTREWLQFVSESQNATPVIAELRDGNKVLGYFTGLTFSKFGLKVLGSSFPGWTTPYIGFNLNASISRRYALEALEKFYLCEVVLVRLKGNVELRQRRVVKLQRQHLAVEPKSNVLVC